MSDVNITVEVSGIDRARHALDQLEDSLDRLERAGARVNRAFRDTGRTVGDTTDAVQDLRRSVGRSTSAIRDKSSVLRRVIVNFNRFLGKIRVISFVIGGLTASILALRNELVALGTTIGGVFAEIQLESARDRMEAFSGSLQAAEQRISSFNDTARSLGFRITGIVDQMGRLEIAAQQAGLTMGESSDLAQGFMSAASDLGVTTDDTASILEDLTSIINEGRVEMGELVDLLEFTNRPVEILAEAFGETESAIEAMSDMGIEFRVRSLLPIARAMERTEPVAQGLTGAFNRLFDTIMGLLRTFNQTGVIGAMTRQMGRLQEILQSPQAAIFMERMGRAMREFIDTTLPEFAASFIRNWESILDTLRSVAGFLIGSAVGGLAGGVIGAIVGAHDELRRAFLDAAGAAGSFAFDVIKAANDVDAEVGPTARTIANVLTAIASAARTTAKTAVSAFNDVADAVDNAASAFQRLSETPFVQSVLDLLRPLLDRINELGKQGLSKIREFLDTLESMGGGRAVEFLGKINPMFGALLQTLEKMEGQASRTDDATDGMQITISKAAGSAQNAEQSMIGLMDAQRKAMQEFDTSFTRANTRIDRFSSNLRVAAMNFGTLEEAARRVGNTIRASFVSAFASVFRSAKSLGDALENAFKSIVDAILEELARLAAHQVFKLVLNLVGLKGGDLSNPGSGLSSGFAQSASSAIASSLGSGAVEAGTGATAGLSLGSLVSTFVGGGLISGFASALSDVFGGGLIGGFGSGILHGIDEIQDAFQTGGSRVVSSPTMIGVGEHNQPEKVTVEPLSGGSRGGGGAIVFQGPTIVDEITMSRFARTIAEAQRREGRRRI